jgi:hypothetical protein
MKNGRARAWYHCARLGGRMLCTYFIHAGRAIKSMNECWCRESWHMNEPAKERERRSFAQINHTCSDEFWSLLDLALFPLQAIGQNTSQYSLTPPPIKLLVNQFSTLLIVRGHATSLNRTRCTPQVIFPFRILHSHATSDCHILSTRFAIAFTSVYTKSWTDQVAMAGPSLRKGRTRSWCLIWDCVYFGQN